MADDKKKDVPWETIMKLQRKNQKRGAGDKSDKEKQAEFQRHRNERGDFEDDGGKKKPDVARALVCRPMQSFTYPMEQLMSRHGTKSTPAIIKRRSDLPRRVISCLKSDDKRCAGRYTRKQKQREIYAR
jgi:hypothetical protein